MATVLDLLGLTTVRAGQFLQSREEAPDVASYSEGAVMTQVFACDLGSDPGTTTIVLQTAVENAEDRYIDLCTLGTLSQPLPPMPHRFYVYLSGPTGGESTKPGFARYLRVAISQTGTPQPFITLDVKAVLKP